MSRRADDAGRVGNSHQIWRSATRHASPAVVRDMSSTADSRRRSLVAGISRMSFTAVDASYPGMTMPLSDFAIVGPRLAGRAEPSE